MQILTDVQKQKCGAFLNNALSKVWGKYRENQCNLLKLLVEAAGVESATVV